MIYKWLNPSDNKIEKKLTYVIYNKTIDAVIGSGLYIQQDIDKYVNKEKRRISNEFKSFYKSLIFTFLAVLIFSVLLTYFLSKRLEFIFIKYNNLLEKEKNKAEFEAIHDPLTKIPNRRFFNQKLKEEFLRAKRYNTTFSLAMIDIDHFKKINDTYGHDTGDIVLKKMTSFIRKNIRKSDFFARWGGEEFMLIFPYTDLQKAKQICQKLKRELQENEFVQTPVKFTISCGITEFRNDGDIENIIKRVDEAYMRLKTAVGIKL
ncbi:diguanylate cyclase [Lebetimonas sp. JS032]|uniref:diguanylate cyclase n=1 Tax=Lebetimonas sp. JS032 TaxID=990070 RepID=UPI000463BCEC|nr:diguanylate cyclase [Lebetimonas sp. JS032]